MHGSGKSIGGNSENIWKLKNACETVYFKYNIPLTIEIY